MLALVWILDCYTHDTTQMCNISRTQFKETICSPHLTKSFQPESDQTTKRKWDGEKKIRFDKLETVIFQLGPLF